MSFFKMIFFLYTKNHNNGNGVLHMIAKVIKWRHFVFLSLIIAVILIIIGGSLLKPESPEAINLKDEITTIINEQAGATSNVNRKARVSDVVLSQDSSGWDVEISLNADKKFTMISTKQMMWQDSIYILAAVSEINQLDDISLSWIYPVLNAKKDVEDKSVMSFTIDNATRDQLIWKNIEPSILPDLVYDYQEHPVLSQ